MLFIGVAFLLKFQSPPAFPVIILFALVVLVIAFISTETALIILIFSMLLSPELPIGGVPGREVVIRLDDIFLLVIFFGWMARMAINKELGLLRVTPINRPILIYVFICMLSSGIGALEGTTNPKHSMFYIIKYIEYFIVFFMVTNNIKDYRQVKTFVWLMFLTCMIVSAYGLYSSFSLGLRATAPFEGPAGESNTLAGYLIIMMGMMMGIILYARSPGVRFLLTGCLIFIFLPFIYTLSRSGWLGFIGMYGAFLLFSKRSKGILLILLLLSIVMFPALMPQVAHDRIQNTFSGHTSIHVLGKDIVLDESTLARFTSFKRSLDLWAERPLLGRGVPGGGVVSDVQYSRILREVGLAGFLAFLWIICALFKSGLKSYTCPDIDDFERGLSLGFLCALSGILVMGCAAEVFIIIRIMEPFWFLAAIVVVLPELRKRDYFTAEPVPLHGI